MTDNLQFIKSTLMFAKYLLFPVVLVLVLRNRSVARSKVWILQGANYQNKSNILT